MEILVVDDDPSFARLVSAWLGRAGHAVRRAAGGLEALALIREQRPELLLTDVQMPDMNGLSLFRDVRESWPGLPVVLMTGVPNVADAVEFVRQGAVDYLCKPLVEEVLLERVRRLGEERALNADLARAAEADAQRAFVGESPAVVALLERIDVFAENDLPVLVQGESGTGKELVARRIHEQGPRRDRPFVAVNCAALPEALFEAELFGHEKGAFTGAVGRREGRFATAEGGTLFLDEIAEVPLPAQAKLLRVLQERTFEPLGSDRTLRVDVRIVSASHRSLKERVAKGLFRDDLYYRLKVLQLEVPPLRERRADFHRLVAHFLRRFSPEGPLPTMTKRAFSALAEHDYPGNVRELENAILHAAVLARGRPIDLVHLPSEIGGARPAPVIEPAHEPGPVAPLQDILRAAERAHLQRALHATGGRKQAAATLLGISRKSLWEKLRSHGLSSGERDVEE